MAKAKLVLPAVGSRFRFTPPDGDTPFEMEVTETQDSGVWLGTRGVPIIRLKGKTFWSDMNKMGAKAIA